MADKSAVRAINRRLQYYDGLIAYKQFIHPTRQRLCLAACGGKLDFSSREDPAVREHKSRQTDNKKK